MLTMIFVNDLVPDWMMHYELWHQDANGLPFVDLVLSGIPLHRGDVDGFLLLK